VSDFSLALLSFTSLIFPVFIAKGLFMKRFMLHGILPILSYFTLVSASGCGSAPGTVSGMVKAPNGKPLKRGLISFIPDTGKNREPKNASIIDGQYKTDPIPAGPAKVVIYPAQSEGDIQELPPKEELGKGGDLVPRPKANLPKRVVEVHERYSNVDTSGLSLVIKSGENTFNVDLKP
jgi:hypothetical protein